MPLESIENRIKHQAAGAHGVGHGRQGNGDAFEGVTFAEPVQRLVGAELLIEDHGQKTGAGPPAGDDVEWRGRLADLLAIPTRELLPDGLHDLPGARDRLEGLGHVLAELAQPKAAAALAGGRRIDDDPLPGEMLGKAGSRFRTRAGEPGDLGGLGQGDLGGDLVLGCAGVELFERQRHLVDELGVALLAGSVDLPFELGDPQRLVGDQGLVVRRHGLGDGELSLAPQASLHGPGESRPEGGDLVRGCLRRSVHGGSES